MKSTIIRPLEYWFWRAQIGILCACPRLRGILVRLGKNADRSRKLWLKTFFRFAVRAPWALALHCADKIKKRVILPRISVLITTRCTLNCDKCIAHIPDYQQHEDVPLSRVLQDLRALFSCVERIYDLNFAGGEPMLHPDLDVMLRACAASGKVETINILTNGTVIPEEKVFAALRETNAVVRIGRYGDSLQPKAEELKRRLKEHGIRVMHEAIAFWFDMSDLGRLQEGAAKKRFGLCAERLSLPCYNGELHLCSSSCLLMGQGLIPVCKEEYFDLRTISPASFLEQWNRLRKKRVLSSCANCPGRTYQTPRVPVAEQRKRGEEDSC
ncbi:MAG: radical SAM protein [Oscillospiraceae bacterium]|jgi:MoaA/NifB/PqqE/SkfB family radical SAM enzyme|nr:radical SAM protein [Oscillospiraceae bacterium]